MSLIFPFRIEFNNVHENGKWMYGDKKIRKDFFFIFFVAFNVNVLIFYEMTIKFLFYWLIWMMDDKKEFEEEEKNV